MLCDLTAGSMLCTVAVCSFLKKQELLCVLAGFHCPYIHEELLPDCSDNELLVCGGHSSVSVGGTDWPLEVVVVRTAVSRRTLDPLLTDVFGDIQLMYVASYGTRRFILKQDLLQMRQEMVATRANYAVYVCPAQFGILFTIVLYYPENSLIILRGCIEDIGNRFLSWVYTNRQTPPPCALPDDVKVARNKLPIWTLVNNHVVTQGPLRPVRVFLYALQSSYSRAKGWFDAAAEFCSRLDSPGINIVFEPKLVLYFLKTLMVNGFIAWRIAECETLTTSLQNSVSIDTFWNNLGKTAPLAAWICDVADDLIDNADL